ncbi:cryptochrome/photolyase family protein [Robertkochia flava]|uniref:cryptochrome/photolyase family protein n=1 Tax=Robertkochia flava TaxID=3447986 RepID=UPI001CCFA126|nr:cryptochrome/photolyase family protein [Robertkochia marina]
MTRIRLILGDQLNENHSWLSSTDTEVIYLMAEMKQEATYVTHHIQKLIAFFAAMRKFAAHLENEGHRVVYFRITDPDNPQNLRDLIYRTIKEYNADTFEYQMPDEYRLDKQLERVCESLDISCNKWDSEHFFTSRTTLSEFFKGKRQLLMETFYRMMRKEHHILINEDGDPEGGKWNYDKSNRKNWKGDPGIPSIPKFHHDIREIYDDIEKAGLPFLGRVDPDAFNWPIQRENALTLLEHFNCNLLPHFGDFQDAMDTGEPFLFHSRLSFALNAKIISPGEVIEKVIHHYRNSSGDIHISQVEGFIRQILGWREFMRGIYWMQMPGYKDNNFFNNSNPLPDFYWTGKTKMNCLHHCIETSLNHAYAHHIQRLMVTGNFALLTQTHPDETDLWYLGIYIDAVEWVEITNTRGMSQYADGGILATKPYIASANYINKMSNYCKRCEYDHKKRTGDTACPFNALYWNFLDSKKEQLKDNPRMGMMYRLLDKIDENELIAIRKRSRAIMENPDKF